MELSRGSSVSGSRSNFPFPSRVEGFLDCCGESFLCLIYFKRGLLKITSTTKISRLEKSF